MINWRKKRFKEYMGSAQLHPIDREVIQKVFYERGDAFTELVTAIKKQITEYVPLEIRKYLQEEGGEMLRLYPDKPEKPEQQKPKKKKKSAKTQPKNTEPQQPKKSKEKSKKKSKKKQ